MYLDDLSASIRAHILEDCLPDGDSHQLLRLYAVLLRVKGQNVTQSDVHDAWSAWMAERDISHKALVPYNDLPADVRIQDQVFAKAIRAASDASGNNDQNSPTFSEILFPSGPPADTAATQEVFELYKIIVQSSEELVNRRQGVNTFFLTINGALLTASGVILQRSGDIPLAGLGISILAMAGVLLCGAWRSLITSFGQLNRGKFRVINAMERHFKVAIYAAEWEALGRGEDPKIYRSFTSREIWVPNALVILHFVTLIASILVVMGVITINPAK